jgi:SAM-dependent methyltransferase
VESEQDAMERMSNMAGQWSGENVLELSRAYQESCVLTAAADWDLFTVLSPEPMTAEALASAVRADLRGMAVLLNALVAMELLSKEGDVYRVPADVEEVLSAHGAESVLPMVQHQANCLRAWSQLAKVVQTGRPADCEASIRGAAADQEAFIGAMHVICEPNAREVVADVQPGPFRRMLDVGGGSGTWTIAMLEAVPDARGVIFDLPEVIEMARQRMADAGLADRVTFVEGDFYTDELPDEVDFVWLSAIAHQNSREQNRMLFAKVHRALTGGGTLMLRDIVMNDAHTKPAGGTMFAINMLVKTDGGGTYSFREYREDLEAAGFSDVAQVREDAWMNSVIRATGK